MKLVFTFLCAGAVVFMLRFLVALLRERKNLSPRPVRVYFARFDPANRRGEMILMNSKNYAQKDAGGFGKRAAFIVAAAVALALPLHSQQATNAAPEGVTGSASPQENAASQQSDQQIVQELDAMKKRIAQLEAALKQHEAAEKPTMVPRTAERSASVAVPAIEPVENAVGTA